MKKKITFFSIITLLTLSYLYYAAPQKRQDSQVNSSPKISSTEVPSGFSAIPAKTTDIPEKKTYTVKEAIARLQELPQAHDNHGENFTEPPQKKLVKLPGGEEVIEVTYQNGGKTYLPNLPSVDPLEGTVEPPLVSTQEE